LRSTCRLRFSWLSLPRCRRSATVSGRFLSEVNKDRTQLRQTIERETMEVSYAYHPDGLRDKKYILFAESEPARNIMLFPPKDQYCIDAGSLALGSKFEQGVSNDGKGSFDGKAVGSAPLRLEIIKQLLCKAKVTVVSVVQLSAQSWRYG